MWKMNEPFRYWGKKRKKYKEDENSIGKSIAFHCRWEKFLIEIDGDLRQFNLVLLIIYCLVRLSLGILVFHRAAQILNIHSTESLIELNLTGTLPDETDETSAVSEFDGTISLVK